MALVDRESDGHVGWIVLNRPEKLNALSEVLLREFDEVLDDLVQDDAIRCIVIRGEGRAFSVGYDLSPENEAFGPADGERVRAYDDWRRLRSQLERWMDVWKAPKPIIAAIQGYCMGGATQLAVCCDLTVCADDAVIGWPMLPMGGGLLAPTSAWLIGPKRAKEMSYIAGNSFSGEEAAAWGWANRAVPPADLLGAAREMAEKVARIPPDVMRLKKYAINRVMDIQGFSEALYFGAEFDAIGHDSMGCAGLVERVSAVGLKAAIAEFHGQA